MSKTVFDPVELGGLLLKNRVAMAPMTRARSPRNVPNEETARYYAQRAGAGLVITEGTVVSAEGSGFVDCPGLWSREQVAAWQPVTRAVHDQGAAIFAQIWHVGRVSHTSLQPGGAAPVSSTARRAENSSAFGIGPDGAPGFVAASKPVALDAAGIARVVRDFADAAENAVEAGFDGVEIHGANGYLIEQFLNGAVNDRRDAYGSQTVENRIRFALEVVDACAARIGVARVGIRPSPFGRLHDLGDFDGEEETFLALAAALGARGVRFIHIMDQASRGAPAMPADFLAKFRAAYDGVLILAGGMNRRKSDAMIAEGLIDIAAFGAPFTSNPDLVERMRHGWPLRAPESGTFYGGDARGYTDWATFSPREVDA
ncbi:alkene reductase [Amaricoccus solimangrovi]|uniref:Alkene reductase n=1 Tax=Amaricoccus solimangrovi TaxID=2589815 RepID=A0A501WCG4_9RHOB|nr:alkene reductase [Amaricoccus solimangrovi]TPE46512.1 alkene reductase [Amaricoccus solimangrovi]